MWAVIGIIGKVFGWGRVLLLVGTLSTVGFYWYSFNSMGRTIVTLEKEVELLEHNTQVMRLQIKLKDDAIEAVENSNSDELARLKQFYKDMQDLEKSADVLTDAANATVVVKE